MNIYVGEYSASQKAYHISTLNEVISNNIIAIGRKTNSDYLPVCYGYSVEEVRRQLEEIQNRIEKI